MSHLSTEFCSIILLDREADYSPQTSSGVPAVVTARPMSNQLLGRGEERGEEGRITARLLPEAVLLPSSLHTASTGCHSRVAILLEMFFIDARVNCGPDDVVNIKLVTANQKCQYLF